MYVLYHYRWYTIKNMIQIVTGDARPIFKQIVDGIRMQIMTGEMQVGDKLPSVRGLSMQLVVNTNTVAKAYAELLAQGLVESRKGLGLYVIEPKQMLSEAEREHRLQQAIDSFINEVMGLGFDYEDVTERLRQQLKQLKDQQD